MHRLHKLKAHAIIRHRPRCRHQLETVPEGRHVELMLGRRRELELVGQWTAIERGTIAVRQAPEQRRMLFTFSISPVVFYDEIVAITADTMDVRPRRLTLLIIAGRRIEFPRTKEMRVDRIVISLGHNGISARFFRVSPPTTP